MTFLILTLGVLYAASWCFVGGLLTRTLWRERSAPLDGTALRHLQDTAIPKLERPAVADRLPATKSA